MLRILLCLISFSLVATEQPVVQGVLIGRLGNQMFQVAAVSALAWDNDATPIFPSLEKDQKMINMAENQANIFWKLPKAPQKRRIASHYRYLSLTYKPIPYKPNMSIIGYFQSEKYFAHHRERILDLYEAHPRTKATVHQKYQAILNHPKSVGVHIRCYWPFQPKEHINGAEDGKGFLPFLGFDFFKRAIKQFSDDHLFVIFSDNIPACKKALTGAAPNIVFIANEPHYHDLYLMSCCKHNIISNSSFSWWGAYLNRNPEKMVIAPKRWFEDSFKENSEDIIPDSWIRID